MKKGLNFLLIFLLPLVLSLLYLYCSPKTIPELCEIEKCPFCFGDNLCKHIFNEEIQLTYESFLDWSFNIISVKNVYFGLYNNQKVVLKKLAYNYDFKILDSKANSIDNLAIHDLEAILNRSEDLKDFVSCNSNTTRRFLRRLIKDQELKQIWTLLNVNVEPLLLKIFSQAKGWPVPKLHGFCGRVCVVEHRGHPLNYYKDYNWFDRANLSLQLLLAAKDFTDRHNNFRLYITDLSPDNIVVEEETKKLSFIDLENAIILEKNKNVDEVHYTKHFEDEPYIFSSRQICKHSISDHNIYAVCRLMLSKKAPWPMMRGGLLHSPPFKVTEKYKSLFINIELCVYSSRKWIRFEIADILIKTLQDLLNSNIDYNQ